MFKILDFIITKLEKSTIDTLKKEMYRNILDSIDVYKCKSFGLTTLRYYRYKPFQVDRIKESD